MLIYTYALHAINVKEKTLLLRDLVWKVSKWKTDSLKHWVKKENPEILIVFPGQSLFVYSITKYISKLQSIPVVFFYTDEYYYYLPKIKSILYKLSPSVDYIETSFAEATCSNQSYLHGVNIPAKYSHFWNTFEYTKSVHSAVISATKITLLNRIKSRIRRYLK